MNEATELQRPQERESTSRAIVIHFIRHGQAQYTHKDDLERHLTDKGREQVREAASVLFDKLGEGEIVGFYSSPRRRAKETVEEIQKELKKLCQERDKSLMIHNFIPKTFNRLNIDDQASVEYLNLIYEQKQDPVDFWLKNPGETSQRIERNFRRFLEKFQGLASRLSPVGPNIHLVCVTHTGPSEVFIGGLLGGRHPGNLDNCERFSLRIPVATEKSSTLSFKDQTQEVDL